MVGVSYLELAVRPDIYSTKNCFTVALESAISHEHMPRCVITSYDK